MANLFKPLAVARSFPTVKYSINRINLFSAATCNFCPIAEMSPAHWVTTFVSASQKLIINEDLAARLAQVKHKKEEAAARHRAHARRPVGSCVWRRRERRCIYPSWVSAGLSLSKLTDDFLAAVCSSEPRWLPYASRSCLCACVGSRAQTRHVVCVDSAR